MGKRARLKKQARVEQVLQERQQITLRRREARSPTFRLVRKVILAIIVTIILLYVGQIINQKIAKAASQSEASR